MALKFNNAGPSKASSHYILDPLARLDYDELMHYIDDERYFVLHAPRQTGKTTALLALMERLNAEGHYRALYVNIEGAQTARNNVEMGIGAVVSAMARSAELYWPGSGADALARGCDAINVNDRLSSVLQKWSMQVPERPLVLILDEVDALVGDTLVSLLRQLRAGYAQRPAAFPQSVILCGVRDVRDYRIHTGNGEIITGGSAFNVKAKSLRLGNFTREQTRELWEQHTKATGQCFDEAIWPELWEDTWGQPWLVNALGHECTWEDRELRKDRSLPVTLERYRAARERLIYSRATHLDQLTDKLSEERVHRVVAALLSGEEELINLSSMDDRQYVEDLGLIRTRPNIAIANRIYQEVIPRDLTWVTQTSLIQEKEWYQHPDGRLDMSRLLAAFQQFFREHADAWIEQFQYKEAGPHLLLLAFLQRIVNGGARVTREYGLGRKRMDVFIEFPLDEAQGFSGSVQRIVLELKLLRQSLEKTLSAGIPQTLQYATQVGADEAHLLVFQRDPAVEWDQRIWQKNEILNDKTLMVWGM